MNYHFARHFRQRRQADRHLLHWLIVVGWSTGPTGWYRAGLAAVTVVHAARLLYIAIRSDLECQ